MIDIRELRIDSTVLFNGERVKVEGVVIQNGIVFVENDNAYADMLDPIPITEELLKELGFEKSTDNIIGVPIFAKTIDNDFHIEVKKFHGYDEWRFHVDDCDRDSLGFLDVHYLHEAQAFVYLTTKQELI